MEYEHLKSDGTSALGIKFDVNKYDKSIEAKWIRPTQVCGHNINKFP